MRTLYFDCFAGVSGDMILGAMVAAGVDPSALKDQLSLLDIPGFTIEFEKVDRSGISATYASVETRDEHQHRHLKDILRIIEESHLSGSVKTRASLIFSRLAAAEAQVHNQSIAQVHFHEVGALDAIVDVVGAAICFDLLAIENFVCSALHVGSGTVEMSHGRFPVPPPAVTELLKGIPIYSSDISGELVTPTGAAIIATVCGKYGPIPNMKLELTGFGAGTREYERFPNVLRVLVGQEETVAEVEERLWMIETNVDDLSSQYYGHVMDRAFELGALDCYFTPVQMKKNRPGVLLSLLSRPEDRAGLTEMLFYETTTLGVRSYDVRRSALQRENISVETQYGPIDVKVARFKGVVINAMPEYERCREAAKRAKVPLRVVAEAAKMALSQRKT